MSAAAALLTAATSWVLVAGFCILGWISVPEMKVSSVLQLGTQGWLLAHGISVGLPGAQLSIIPLGLTAVIAALGLGLSAQAVIHSPPPEPGMVGARLGRLAAVYGLTYVVVLTIARSWTEGGRAGQSSLLWAAALVFGLGLIGFARALAWRPPGVPLWLRAGAWGVVAGLCVMVVSGVAVVMTALISGRDRVGLVHESLDPGGLGGTMLLLGQLAWLPNYIAWGGAWAVGAGVQLGLDTVISPAQSLVGMLPAIPVLGAVPPAGPMSPVQMLWLASGVVAGVAAAFVLVSSLQRSSAARGQQLGLDVAAIAGALAGVVAGAVFTLLQFPASGDLGNIRLVNLGARIGVLAVMAPSTMGLAGMATGAVMGWLAGRGTAVAPPQPAAPGVTAADPAQEAEPEAAHDAEADVPTSVVQDRRTAEATGDADE